MLERLIAIAAVITLGTVTILFLWGGEKSDTPSISKENVSGQRESRSVSGRRTLPLPLPALPSMAPDATAKTNSDVPAFTVKSVESIGLLGRDARWVAKVMNKSNWRPVGDESEATFENTNGIRMAYQIHRGRVIGARARFPEDALSADLTALSEYFVGNRGHFPFHWEARTRPKKTRRMGRFQHRDERYIYYRGILHTTGEPPFGPKEIEISLFPFENQTLMMDKHPDEHDSDAQDPGEVPTPE